VAQLTIAEAAGTYESAMRNVPPAEQGAICAICRTFIGDDYRTCLTCSRQLSLLDVVAPITYSEHLGQIHDALWGYKDGLPQVQNYAMPRLAAILWKFVERHERCVAEAAGAPAFDLVTSVPSSRSVDDDRRSNFRTIIGWCRPIADRYERVLRATDQAAPGRAFDERRYTATRSLAGANVLLLDDTWTGGGHAQSACHALQEVGAAKVGLIVIGRHVRREWAVVMEGPTCGEKLDALPKVFDWETCTAHV
jgi:predicted amidophosphoribosyltransferase